MNVIKWLAKQSLAGVKSALKSMFYLVMNLNTLNERCQFLVHPSINHCALWLLLFVLSLLSSSYSQKKLKDNCYRYASPKPLRIVCLQIPVPYLAWKVENRNIHFFVRTLSKVLNSISMHLRNSRYYAGSDAWSGFQWNSSLYFHWRLANKQVNSKVVQA